MSETAENTEVQPVTDDLDAYASEFFGEKKVAEPAAKPEVEQDDTDDTTTEDTEAQKPNDELTDEDEAAAEEELSKAPKKSKVQERIDELVKQREDARRDAASQMAELRKEFEAKLEALKPAQREQKTAEPTPDDQKEDGTAKYDLGEFDPSYIRDLTRYTLAQERAQAEIVATEQRRTAEQQTQQAALAQSWSEKVTVAKEKYPDLEQKGNELLAGFQNLQPEYSDYLSTVLMSMDYGPDVLHYLADNPDEATKIVNSGAQKATLALGRIEAKFAEAEAQKLVAKPKLSKAPPPPNVSARGTGGGAKTIEPDTDDLDAFEKEFYRKRR